VLKLVDNLRGVASVKLGSGNTFLFCSNNWEVNGSSQPIRSRFPRLSSFVLNKNLSASEVLGVRGFDISILSVIVNVGL
jgi:hypothetical protein